MDRMFAREVYGVGKDVQFYSRQLPQFPKELFRSLSSCPASFDRMTEHLEWPLIPILKDLSILLAAFGVMKVLGHFFSGSRSDFEQAGD